LVGFRKLRDENLKSNLLNKVLLAGSKEIVDNNIKTYETLKIYKAIPGNDGRRFDFGKPTLVNCLSLSEPIQFGQTIKQFEIVLSFNEKPIERIKGTTIGRKRIITFPAKEITSISLFVENAKGSALISEVAAYFIDQKLIEK